MEGSPQSADSAPRAQNTINISGCLHVVGAAERELNALCCLAGNRAAADAAEREIPLPRVERTWVWATGLKRRDINACALGCHRRINAKLERRVETPPKEVPKLVVDAMAYQYESVYGSHPELTSRTPSHTANQRPYVLRVGDSATARRRDIPEGINRVLPIWDHTEPLHRPLG